MKLEVKELCGGYGAKLVLDGIGFEVEPGSVVSLLGANGCGKSTLLKMIGRILTPKSGSILLDGKATVSIYEGEKLLTQREIDGNYCYGPENPILWNAEKPFLYTVVLERFGEEITLKQGLRSIKISDEYALLINGVAVKLHGVNHHDTSKYRGWCQSDE